ncbi:hypothetical protein ASG92_02750 [Arthrobacter sp. Soil736]|uniref:DUF5691 domain-containing protein n=1 Tax=Arthrobacter sp. Soil736 TaxID=1736395 RepID=UPI0006F8FE3C|nr:DUF5691 domain-containing protein [Arthrobacter sp. Soil736]KRE63858.1 hypothetical protein ASG92_02750 [Arthrobacter sp. Soil736]
MTWLADLRSSALVGTGRHAVPAPAAELEFRPPDGLSREELLLDQAALADVVTRAARRPSMVDTAKLPDAAPPEDARPASADAVRLLDLLLNQPPVGPELRTQLVTDWLQFAAASGRRVPHRLIPGVLALAEAKPAVAEHVDPAIGTRGRWLQGLRQKGSGPKGPAPKGSGPHPATTIDWAELRTADATAELERLRHIDPAAARDRVHSHWDTLSARERAAHLAAFAINLELADEGLLEKALDDKAISVRDVAADLLDRLPGSARGNRMAARLKPLLRVKGLLRKQFEIDLPPDPDPAALRDGIAAAPRTGEPDRLGRLDTIIRGAPLGEWTTVADRSTAATLAMLDGEPRVIDTIIATAALRADAEWVRALLDIRTDAGLLGCLPAAEREQALLRHIRSGTAQPMALVPLLRDLPRPWGPPLANAVLELLTAKNGGQLATMLSGFLPMALPPDTADQCRRLLQRSDDDGPRRRVFRDVVQYQSFRQSLTEAFQ